MANNLFPEEEELILEEEEEQTEEILFLEGYLFGKDFYTNGKNEIIPCSAADSWIFWCDKALKTPRGKCDAYTDDYGIDFDAVFAASTHSEAENILTSEIKNTLEADPYNRTAYVDTIIYDWIRSDTVVASISIVGYEGITATIEETISY